MLRIGRIAGISKNDIRHKPSKIRGNNQFIQKRLPVFFKFILNFQYHLLKWFFYSIFSCEYFNKYLKSLFAADLLGDIS